MTYENFVFWLWVYAGVFVSVVVWIIVSEIMGLFLLKKNLRDLEPIMQQWVDNYNLTSQEKQYWWQATKAMSSPLSIVKMMGKVWLLPLRSTQKSPLAMALQNKTAVYHIRKGWYTVRGAGGTSCL